MIRVVTGLHYFRHWGLASLVLVVGLLFTLAEGKAAPDFPALTGRVVDQTGMLTAAETATITATLAAYEERTGNQMAVAIIKSLQGYEIRDYGYQLGRYWKLGEKDKDNGVLILIVPSENRISIEVGYGLEGELTDAASRLIIENTIVPAFRQGLFAQGIESSIHDIIAIVTGEKKAPESRSGSEDRELGTDDIIPLLFMLFVIFIITRASRGGGRGRGLPFILGPVGFRGGSFGGGGGLSGGFSGGGGSFGGGGASGRW